MQLYEQGMNVRRSIATPRLSNPKSRVKRLKTATFELRPELAAPRKITPLTMLIRRRFIMAWGKKFPAAPRAAISESLDFPRAIGQHGPGPA
ncbi:MAG: hypothetical protein KGL46_05825 [Hyphomicrobiales bacterium]|nr:hypothetical protein [Hyphomicrobiales bacterium]